jgi:hypothetical protein
VVAWAQHGDFAAVGRHRRGAVDDEERLGARLALHDSVVPAVKLRSSAW